ncbi:MAG: hypothetical protein JWP87_5380 [Labilithrix sp.]|nr:hypothetical protein [Labilithrix sp.]
MSGRRVVFLLVAACAGVGIACNSLLGLTDFEITPDGPADASDETPLVSEGGAGCADGGTSDADLTKECYPCAPLSNEQLLNGCTGAQCIPFDRARLTNLLPDGGLPALPPDPDGGM